MQAPLVISSDTLSLRIFQPQWHESGKIQLVVNDHRVVLGRLGRKAIGSHDGESVEEAMTEGPSTVRPSIGLDALLKRMQSKNLTSWLVTTPDGKLVGLVLRSQAEERLASSTSNDT